MRKVHDIMKIIESPEESGSLVKDRKTTKNEANEKKVRIYSSMRVHKTICRLN